MNKLLVLAILTAALSPCLGQGYGEEGHVSSEELVPADQPGCPGIKFMNNLDMRHFYGEWHVPFVSNYWTHYKSKKMHGKFMQESRLGQTNVKMDLKPMPEEQMAQNDNATVWVHSKCPRTGAELNLACTPTAGNNAKWFCRSKDSEDHGGDSWVYVADSDSKTWAVVFRCFPNNGIYWAVFTKAEEVDPMMVKELIKDDEEIGRVFYKFY